MKRRTKLPIEEWIQELDDIRLTVLQTDPENGEIYRIVFDDVEYK